MKKFDKKLLISLILLLVIIAIAIYFITKDLNKESFDVSDFIENTVSPAL